MNRISLPTWGALASAWLLFSTTGFAQPANPPTPPPKPSPEERPPGSSSDPAGASPSAAATPAPPDSAAESPPEPAVQENPPVQKVPAGQKVPPAEVPAGQDVPAAEGAAGQEVSPASAAPAPQATPAPAPKATPSPATEGSSGEAAQGGAGRPPSKTAAEPKLKKYQLGILLDATIGLGNTAKFVSQPSIQGFSIDARYYITANIGVGVGAAFDTLSERKDGTVEWDNVTATGEHTKQISFTPLLAKGVYAFRKNPKYTPYLSLGVGAARHASQLFAGSSTMRNAAWHFAVAPEVGVTVGLSKATLLGCLRLNYLSSSNDIPSQLFANLGLGIAIQ